MKKCLVTGAAGNIGIKLIESLVDTKRYEITAFDLKSPKAIKRLSKYQNKINIVYGDINDDTIIRALVKDHDVIFHLAGILPYNADVNSSLVKLIDYHGSKSIIDFINELNPKAHLFYLSTTTLYGSAKRIKTDSDINIYINDYYSQNKYQIEKYIQKTIKNYTIYRLPMVLIAGSFENVMYNIPLNSNVEVITDTLVADALTKSLSNLKKLNKKIYVLSGGKKYQTNTNELLRNILNVHGITLRYIVMKWFIPQNFYTHYYDTKEIEEILKYQKGTIEEIFTSYQNTKKFKRCLNRLFAYNSLRKLSKKD